MARAEHAVDFLLGIQLESGAFPGLEIAENRTEPSTFNSAQILTGLTAWHKETGDDRTLTSAFRVAEWLRETQESDGVWRKHLYGTASPYTYMAHASCWLAEFGVHVGEPRFVDAGRVHLHWVLEQVREETGWIDYCGFGGPEHASASAHTHTIAYTIWGVLLLSQICESDRGLAVARRAARAVARRLELSKWLPGRLDSHWRAVSDSACLTGNAQMALIWFELHRMRPELPLVNAALKALDLVKRGQTIDSSNPGIRGGVPGSVPLNGEYIRWAVPNWAAKFFIDALIEKRHTLAALQIPVGRDASLGAVMGSVPTTLPESVESAQPPPVRVGLLADEWSDKVEKFAESWQSWDFCPDVVFIRPIQDPPAWARAIDYGREHGVARLFGRVLSRRADSPSPIGGTTSTEGGAAPTFSSASEYCRARGLRMIELGSWTEPEDLAKVRSESLDILVHAGAGIMRQPLIDIPRLGILNAHMGVLPRMRGMNATEWSVALGEPTGCTVHLIDPGIDTGSILLVQPVDTESACSVSELRSQVDHAQVEALGSVLSWICRQGDVPPPRSQARSEGHQYFSMHGDLKAILEQVLQQREGKSDASLQSG